MAQNALHRTTVVFVKRPDILRACAYVRESIARVKATNEPPAAWSFALNRSVFFVTGIANYRRICIVASSSFSNALCNYLLRPQIFAISFPNRKFSIQVKIIMTLTEVSAYIQQRADHSLPAPQVAIPRDIRPSPRKPCASSYPSFVISILARNDTISTANV